MQTCRHLALASVLLAACHSATTRQASSPDYADERGVDRASVLLSDWRPTPPQKCTVATYPERLPAAESLIATADMPVLLKQGGIDMARGSALLSLKFDSTGHVERARVIEGTVADDVAPILEQVVLSAIEPQVPGRAWGVRLLIELDSVPRYRVGRSERCAAVPAPAVAQATRTEIDARVVGVSVGSLPPGRSISPPSKRVFSLKYLIAVDARGQVVDVKQIGASSENAILLRANRDHLASQRWLPELDDRIPVETIVERTERVEEVLAPAP